MNKKKIILTSPQKSPYNFERFDSTSELNFAHNLEKDSEVLAWTKEHDIKIPYRNKEGRLSTYLPDFLVRKKNQNRLFLIEIKGGHLKYDPNVKLKEKAAKDWCHKRAMTYSLIEA